jgi:hypothetical protein
MPEMSGREPLSELIRLSLLIFAEDLELFVQALQEDCLILMYMLSGGFDGQKLRPIDLP